MARLTFLSGPREGEQVDVDAELTVGRSDADVLIEDSEISRRHASFRLAGQGLEVRDLGSTNGTWVDGARIARPVMLTPGAKVRMGRSELQYEVQSAPTTIRPVPAAPTPPAAPPPPATAPRGPGAADLEAIPAGGAVVRFRPGTVGERAAGEMASAAGGAMKRLRLDPNGTVPQICLVDPFPDPADPTRLVAHGSIVDPAAGEVWMAVTAESPPEPPERPLALVLGGTLPAGEELEPLLEGWGLHIADAPDPDGWLEGRELPRMASADGDLRGAMTLSFVRFLIAEGGVDGFLKFLSSAQPGRVDDAAQDAFGHGLAVLEERWRRKVADGVQPVKTAQFMRLTARYLRPYKGRLAETFLWMLLGLAFTVVFPFAFKELLDSAIPSGEFSEVATILALLGAAFVVTLLAGLRRSYLNAWVSSAVVRDLRMRMFERIQRLESGWFSRHEAGDVLTRLFNDVEGLEFGLSQAIREGAFQVITLVVSAVILMLLNPLLGAIVLLGAPLVAVVYRLMASEAQRRSLKAQNQFGEMTAVATESYGGQSVVKAFALEAREVARFGRASDRLFKSEVSLQLFGGFFSLSVELVVTALRIAVLALGAYLIIEGNLTIGALVAFISLMGEVIAPVTVLTNIGQQIQQSSGSLVRINEVLDAVPEIADAEGAVELEPLRREIELRDVSFSYTPERPTLEGVSATIPAGSKVAFVGPSGAGKSSVLQLLMRFYDPSQGAVLFDGTDIRSGSVASLRGQLGVVFQDTFLFNTTIRENVALGCPGATPEQIDAAARAARLDEFVSTLPEGYETVVGEGGGRLSGGQRQRLAIARALVRNPSVLLLDEATSALDPRTESLISETIDQVSEGRTTISVTHRLTSITHFDRIFVIAAGGLAEEGTHDELLRMGGVYATLWAEQTGAIEVPQATLDVPAALGRVPLFSRLTAEQLAEVERRLRVVELGPGQTLPEGGGRLVFVQRGQASTLAPGLGGELVPQAQLFPGDSFGLGALLGDETGAVLEAEGPVSLLVLGDDELSGLAALFDDVRAALHGSVDAAAPASGRRLEAVSRVMSSPVMAPGSVRLSGVHSGVQQQVLDRVSRATNRIPVIR